LGEIAYDGGCQDAETTRTNSARDENKYARKELRVPICWDPRLTETNGSQDCRQENHCIDKRHLFEAYAVRDDPDRVEEPDRAE
jgi:hypothetical protein